MAGCAIFLGALGLAAPAIAANSNPDALPSASSLSGAGSESPSAGTNPTPLVLPKGSAAANEASGGGAPRRPGVAHAPPSWTPPPQVNLGESVYGVTSEGSYSVGRQIVFNWTPDQAFTILTRPGAVTDIELANGESAETMALGDLSRWMVKKTSGDIFIKPVTSGLYTSATLVTNKHRYQLLLVSVPPGSPWYQSVAWRGHGFTPQGAGMIGFSSDSGGGATTRSSAGGGAPQAPRRSTPTRGSGVRAAAGGAGNPGNPVNLVKRLKLNYKVRGHAPWKPVRVFAMNHKTYIQFPPHTDSLPALFVKTEAGQSFSLANYVVRGDYIIYPHIFHKALLRLGHVQVWVVRIGAKTG